ncbi:CASP-like protein 2A1 [Impatiens glandulifera]|uniref:CASP-like protein 2A1 n=1 Tax=Impatiens glandulifera TaxID=253017 RepID=UPI001FB18D5F|nr:CASP-like protein 2A1 [Impatiens glandulifera]
MSPGKMREDERVLGSLSPAPVVAVQGGDEKAAPMRSAETLLRLLSVGLCVASLVIMLKNSQTNDFGSVSYQDLGAFKFLVHANGICAGYSLVSSVVTAVPHPSTICRAWTFFVLDQVITYFILAAGSVSTEVAYLAYKGDTSITWSEACGSFGSFCHKATAAISITFAVALCFVGLSIVSSYRLFSKYDAPAVAYSAKGLENGTPNRP